jgi:hypothetical protein
MYSSWIAQLTPDNIDYFTEYGARYGLLSRKYLEETMESYANHGEDTYILVYNPEARTSVAFYLVTGSEVKERYTRIPVFHPEGHLQEFILHT